MAMFLSRRWRRQPQYPVVVDRNNPLSRNLECVLLGPYQHNLVNGAGPFSYVAGAATSVGQHGRARVIDGAGVEHHAIPAHSSFETLFFFGQCVNTAATQVYSGAYTATGYGFSYLDYESGKYAFWANDGVPPLSESSYTTTAPVIGETICLAGVTRGAASRELWLLGSLVGSSTENIDTTTTDRFGATYREDAINYPSLTHSGLYLSAYWGRALNNSELVEISHNPWQIFAPQRSVTYFLGTAGVNQGVGGASGTSTVAALSGSVAASTGAATVLAVSGFVARSDGVATASAVSGAVGEASGAGTASALAGALGDAAGTATVAGLSGAIGQSAGTGTAAGVSASAAGAGAAAGTSTVTGLAGSVGQAAGTSAAQSISSSSSAVGQSAGTSTAAAIAGSIGQASGTSTASGITSAAVGVGESAGTSNVIALSGAIGSAAGTGTAVALQGSVGTSSGTATVLAFRGSIAAASGTATSAVLSGSVAASVGASETYAYSSASVGIADAAGTSNVIALSGARADAAGIAAAVAYSAGPPGDLPTFRSGAAGTRPTAAERRRPAVRSRYGTA